MKYLNCTNCLAAGLSTAAVGTYILEIKFGAVPWQQPSARERRIVFLLYLHEFMFISLMVLLAVNG